jgi:hypothetical protein
MHIHALALTLLAGAVAAQSPSLLYAVPNPTPAQALQLRQHFDVLDGCCGPSNPNRMHVELDRTRLGLLFALAPQAVFVEQGRPFHDIRLERLAAAGPDAPDPGYYTVAEIEAEIDAAVAAYPAIARKVDLGQLVGGMLTHQGRTIYALKVSDHVALDEDEPAILLAAQHHARELNSPHMVIGAMQRVLAGYATDPQIQAAVDEHELWFVPMVNPDGVDFVWTTDNLWRKNRRNNGSNFGVDLNRNYPYLWGLCGASTTTSSQIYRGPSAGSEPETQIMRAVAALLRPEVYLDFHSHGREVLRTWAPCATVHPSIDALVEHYTDDLRVPMNYGKRDPSASGEAPEDHAASGGAMSFLVEVGTAFQPVFTETVTEEARVWPGIRQALTVWRPAVRGHVTSAQGSTPLAATVTYAPNLFSHGEVSRARARDGRYGLWLPLGTWDVTYAAPGHQSKTVTVTAAAYDAGQVIDVVLQPTAPVPTTTKSGSGSIGTAVTFTYTSPGDAGRTALFGWSFGTSPGIDLGGQRVIPLNNDPFFEAAWGGNPFLAPTWVTLGATDSAQAILTIPNETWLIGITTHVAGITFDPAWHYTIKTWSQPVAVTILP